MCFWINFQVYQQLVEKTKSTPGAKVENNKYCVTVHFRCVDEKVGFISIILNIAISMTSMIALP